MKTTILVSPNAFKGSLSSIDAARIIQEVLSGIPGSDLICELAPIADGGDGTIDVFKFYFQDSKFVDCVVHDPLMRKIKSKWLLLDDNTAVVELAKASGLSLLKNDELNPMWANTFGVGELILSALDEGCTKIILTLGGSATVDAGIGILQAIGVKVFDKKKKLFKGGGGFLSSIDKIDLNSIDKRLKNCILNVLCDVKIPLIGEKGTVQKFSTQKGAKEGEKFILENGMNHFVQITKGYTGVDCATDPMVGSAGGVAYTLKVFLNAILHPGFLYLSKMISLENKIKNSDLIITGEGYLDDQSLMGKATIELAKLANKYNKKVIVLCGDYDKSIDWRKSGIYSVIQIRPEEMPVLESLKNTKDLIKTAIEKHSGLFINS